MGWTIEDINEKELTGTLYQVRLSCQQRAIFTVDDKAQKVKVIAVGGHT